MDCEGPAILENIQIVAHHDVKMARDLRPISMTEMHAHSFLEVIPLMAFSFLAVLHPDQSLALFGVGKVPPRFALRPKRPPLPRRYVDGILSALTAFIVFPYAEEFWRCYRVDKSLASRPESAASQTTTLHIPANPPAEGATAPTA